MVDALLNRLHGVVDVRRGEALPTGLMFLYGFLALASFYVAKPVRNSLLLDRMGADALPLAYLLTAVVVTVVMVLYTRHAHGRGHRSLLMGTLAVLVGALVGFWWLLRGGSPLGSGAFYVWGKLYPVLLVSQFWLVGGLLFTTRQAKRLFGPIGLGLILGGVAGSLVAGLAAEAAGTENLLLLSALLLASCALPLHRLLRRLERCGGKEAVTGGSASRREADGDAAASPGGGEEPPGLAATLRSSPHLRQVAWILGLTVLVGTLVDWQFNRAVELFVQGEDARTAFFGRFFAVVNLASVGVQLLGTSLLLRRRGIGTAMLVLPLGLLLAGSAVVLAPALLTVALLKGTEGSLRYSLDQSTRELLFLPVPTDLRLRAKPLLDLAVQRGGTGVAGLLLLLLVNGLGFSLRGVAVAALVPLLLWIVATVRMRREFRRSVRRLIRSRDVDLERLIVQRLDAETVRQLRQALRRGSEGEVLFALSLLETQPSPELEAHLVELLRHRSGRVRARAVALLSRLAPGRHVEAVEALLRDPRLEVRVEAVYHVCAHADRDAAGRLAELTRASDPLVRTAALACAVRHGDEREMRSGLESIRALARSDAAAERRSAARLLGQVEDRSEEICRILWELLGDPASRVRREALRSAGPATASWLFGALREMEDPQLRYRALKTLNVLRRGGGGDRGRGDGGGDGHGAGGGSGEDGNGALSFPVERVRKLARREIRQAAERALALAELENGRTYGPRRHADPTSLLERTLAQRRDEAVERTLRTLALGGAARDVLAAAAALRSRDPLDRARGLELLETVLEGEERRWFDPVLDDALDPGRRARLLAERFRLRRLDSAARVEALAGDADPWITLLARHEHEPSSLDRQSYRTLVTAGLSREPSPERPGWPGWPGAREVLRRIDLLRTPRLFARLRIEDLGGLAVLARRRRYPPGGLVAAEGSAVEALLVVASGGLEGRRGERRLFWVGPGETAGELALLDGRPLSYRMVAPGDTSALALGREDVLRLLEDRFPAVRSLLEHLAGLVRERSATIGDRL